MILLLLCMCLAAELYQCTDQVSLDDLKTSNVERQNEIVDKHNELRRGVKPPASNMLKMKWNTTIADNAKKWASTCTLVHSQPRDRVVDGKKCGENLFMASRLLSWSYVCESWYNETKSFVHGVGASPPGAVVGHYTQLVWAVSLEVGCGVAYCPDQPVYKYYYVCQYSPAGNMRDQLVTPYKTGTPCADCPDDCDNGLCTNPCRYIDVYNNCDYLMDHLGCDTWGFKHCGATCACPTEIR